MRHGCYCDSTLWRDSCSRGLQAMRLARLPEETIYTRESDDMRCVSSYSNVHVAAPVPQISSVEAEPSYLVGIRLFHGCSQDKSQ